VLANRLAYGHRAQPYEALSDFSNRLSVTPSPTTLLSAVAEAAGRAVAARRATVAQHRPGAEAVSASWGAERTDGTTSHTVLVRHGGSVLGSIEVDIPRGRPLRPSDERLLRALAEQAAVAFRNAAMEAQLADHVAELDLAAHKLAESRSRIIAADDAARRALEAAISRDVMPPLAALPGQLRRARAAVARGSTANGLDVLVDSTNAALESLRELTHGVFPTQLTRAGIVPALRSLLERSRPAPSLRVNASVAGQRFPARVEAALYYCCVEAVRGGASSIDLSDTGSRLILRIADVTMSEVDSQAVLDRVEAVGGLLRWDAGLLVARIPVGADAAVLQASPVSGSRPRR
jgi:hypothetical protein